MEQRRLRLGDILDDYCPRERRVTNHAVVAMIDEDVKQTRCTTCDAEHAYKGGKEPRKRRKDTPGALYREVLAGLDSETPPVLTPTVPAPPDRAEAVALADETEATLPSGEILSSEPEAPAAEPGAEAPPAVEDGPVHRRLIRATLPRPEGQKEARPLPEFTVRSSGGRGPAGGRGERGHRARGPAGTRPTGQGGHRFAGPRGGTRGPGGRQQGPGGFRSPQQPRHGGRKRSR